MPLQQLVPSSLTIPDPAPTLPIPEMLPDRAPLLARIATLTVIILPILGLAATPFLLWGWGFGWVELGLLIGMYVLTALGVTVGFHRLLTHRSFETHTVVRFILAVLGSMAIQGSVLKWVATHRRHHQHSDTPDDPHSPHHHGGGLRGLLRGLWHSHIGWAFRADPPEMDRYVKDLERIPSIRVASSLFPVWMLLGLLIPTVLGGLLTLSWSGALLGFVWGGLIRVFLVHHVTWSVNSVCHLWGGQPYPDRDHSRNNFVFGVLALGEGWHNNHHAFPTSARHGLRWWQIDISYYVILMMAAVGLARKIRVPDQQASR